jgi:hypothetical protein
VSTPVEDGDGEGGDEVVGFDERNGPPCDVVAGHPADCDYGLCPTPECW